MLVATAYLRLLLRALALDEQQIQTLLEDSGINHHDLFQLNGYLPLDQHVTLLSKTLSLSNNPAFGLYIGSQLQIATHGAIGVAAYTSSTLGEAISTIARYYSIRGQFIDIQLDSTADDIIVKLLLRTECNDVGMFLLEAFLASAQTAIEFITGISLQQARLQLAYAPPAHAEQYYHYFHMPITFNQAQTAVILPIQLLRLPSLFADPAAKLQAEQQCEQQFRDLQYQPSIAAQVTALLRTHTGRLWTLPEVANALHLSERTLMRRLKDEGLRYQTLHDAELHRQTVIYLNDKRHTTESLAAALGYSDTSGFRRAFQRWFGMSLGEYLRRES